jgi:hypothetical protein
MQPALKKKEAEEDLSLLRIESNRRLKRMTATISQR